MYYKTADEKTVSKVGERLGLDETMWADKEGFKVEELDFLDGDEAGIKSVNFLSLLSLFVIIYFLTALLTVFTSNDIVISSFYLKYHVEDNSIRPCLSIIFLYLSDHGFICFCQIFHSLLHFVPSVMPSLS